MLFLELEGGVCMVRVWLGDGIGRGCVILTSMFGCGHGRGGFGGSMKLACDSGRVSSLGRGLQCRHL